ncbi:MAG: flagellar basal body-associated FliL family protein [Pseudomonadota bacterium]
MADTTADGDTQEAAGKGKMIKLAGAGGGVAVLLLAGVYFFVGTGSDANVTSIDASAAIAVREIEFYELPEITVNLSQTGPRPQYLKLQVALELSDKSLKERIAPLMPRVIDAFQVYLRELRADDLEGSAGMFRLKDELRKRINTAIAPARVDAVLFQEMLVQ